MMEDKPPFKSLGHALGWFNEHNPARARSMNVLEPERGQKPSAPDFSGHSPTDIHASILAGITKIIEPLDHDRKWAFLWRNMGDRTRHLDAEEIAQRLHTSTRNVYRYLRESREALEKEMLRRHLIEPPEDLKSFDEPKKSNTEVL